MRELLGENFDAFKASLDDEPVRAVRINSTKISVDDFLSFFFSEFFQESTTIVYVSLWLSQMNNVEAAFKQSPDESSLVIFTIRFRYCNKFHFFSLD